MREAIATGATIEQAKEAAVKELNVQENEEIKFEIIDIPQKKTLGLFGGCPARVKAFIEITPGGRGQKYLREVLKGMNMTDVSIQMEENGNLINFSLEGKDMGAIIGRRGETLDALQYLTGLAANKENHGDYYRVIINIGNYRETREKALDSLARKKAHQALRYGRNQVLEPMNPYERRIVHNAVHEVEGVHSWSIGDGPHRRVVIGNRDADKGGFKKRPYKHNDSRDAAPRRSDYATRMPRTQEYQEHERFPKADKSDAPLYGRLDK